MGANGKMQLDGAGSQSSHNIILYILYILFMPLCTLQGQVQCSGYGQIQFMWYNDSRNMDAPNRTRSGNGYSDFYFSPLMISDNDENILYEITKVAEYFANNQTVNLTKVKEMENPIKIWLPTNKSVHVNMTVYDHDNGIGEFTRNMTNMVIPFSGKQTGDDWTEMVFNSTDREASLTIRYRLLECDQHFTGYGCNFCTSQFHTCTEEKNKICAANYYPRNYCNRYCSPVEDKYTCQQMTGHKVCRKGRTGSECEECDDHYFGETCATFCRSNEDYSCSDEGEKICTDKNTSPEKDCKKNNAALIAGMSGGCVILVCLLVTAVCVAVKKKKSRGEEIGEDIASSTLNKKRCSLRQLGGSLKRDDIAV